MATALPLPPADAPGTAPPRPPEAAAEGITAVFVFGTYKLKGEILHDSLGQALQLLQQQGRPALVDGAHKYQNLDTVLSVMQRFPASELGYKLEWKKSSNSSRRAWECQRKERESKIRTAAEATRAAAVAEANAAAEAPAGSGAADHDHFGRTNRKLQKRAQKAAMARGPAAVPPPQREEDVLAAPHFLNLRLQLDGLRTALRDASIAEARVFRVLLHNYAGVAVYLSFQKLVDGAFGANAMPIGVCNVSSAQIRELLERGARVNYVQNELHPFLGSTDVPFTCRAAGIAFEAHSCLTSLADYERCLVPTHGPLPQKPAQMALAYAAAAVEGVGGAVAGSLCFASTNYSHLQENLASLPLAPEWLAALQKLSRHVTPPGGLGTGHRPGGQTLPTYSRTEQRRNRCRHSAMHVGTQCSSAPPPGKGGGRV